MKRPDIAAINFRHQETSCGCCSQCSLATLHRDGDQSHTTWPCETLIAARYIKALEAEERSLRAQVTIAQGKLEKIEMVLHGRGGDVHVNY